MREILFRGKDVYTDDWAVGYYEFGFDSGTEEPTYYIWAVNHSEKEGELFMVDPETVGQYTGLKDKNGKKIFEGDIIKNEYESGKYQYFKIVYGEKTLGWKVQNKYELFGRLCHVIGNIEVIGNIHDNPEMLKGEQG